MSIAYLVPVSLLSDPFSIVTTYAIAQCMTMYKNVILVFAIQYVEYVEFTLVYGSRDCVPFVHVL